MVAMQPGGVGVRMWFSKGSDVSVGAQAAAGRVLRPDARAWFSIGVPAAMMLGVGLLLAAPVFDGTRGHATALTLAGVAGVLASMAPIAHLLWSRTVLYPDRIERRDVLGTRTMMRSEVAGYRDITVTRGRSPATDLSSRRDGEKPLRVYLYGGGDDFQVWRSDLPDLDLIDIGTMKAQLLSNPDLGSSPAEREVRLELLKRVAMGFNGGCIAVAAWVWLRPVPYPLAIAAAIALIPAALALVWWSKGVITLAARNADPRSNVSLALFSGMLVGLKAISIGTDQWPAALALGAALATLPVTAIYALNVRWGVVKRGFWGAALLMVAWGWGTVMLVDSAADQAPAKGYRTTVLSRSVHHGRSTTWNVELTPWADHAQADYQVSSDLYDQLADGGAACVGLHPGALSLAWYELHACAEGHASVAAAMAAAQPAAPAPASGQSAAAGAGVVLQPSQSPFLALPKADDMAAYYPDVAQRRNLAGRSKFSCTIDDAGLLTDCVILSETPSGVGFAAATLQVVKLFRMKPVMPDGSSSAGKRFTNSIRWQLPR